MNNNPKKDGNKGFSFARLSKGAFIALGCILAVIVILVGALVGVFFALKTAGRASMADRREEANIVDTDYVYDPDVISYEGKKYRFNRDLSTFLFMGIDEGRAEEYMAESRRKVAEKRAEKNGTSVEYELEKYEKQLAENGYSFEYEDGVGQADVLLLLVLDEKNEHVSIISIDRNSMSYYETFDIEGNNMGASEGQLALAYSYGDGAHESCKMTVSAVSDFLYEIPIHAYYSMNYYAIKDLTDTVGGVEVTIPVDMTATDESFAEGSTIRLTGELAQKYLSARQELEDGSNEGRIERQKQFIFSFIDTAVNAVKGDFDLPIELYNKIAENSCTDLTVDEIVYLADTALNVDISYHSIEGTTDESGTFAEFRPNEDALWQLILDIFYICED
ncbi:MAG: LCP family protein [Clostridia bacterium]|nr:LCP family protein [Clostridia bacterium]